MSKSDFYRSAHPLFFDFGALADELCGSPEYKPLTERIRRYQDAMSALNDLRQCRECLDVLRDHDPLRGLSAAEQHRHQTVSSALIDRAIILYVRATKTSSKHRTFVPVRKSMPAHLVPLHERMVALRDDAIAHFGPGPGGSRPLWARETVALRMDDHQASLTLLYSRTGIQTDLPGNLYRLLDYAIRRLWDIASERADDLLAEGKRLHQDDPVFVEGISSHPVDLRKFFNGDEEAVRQAIGSNPGEQDLPKPSYWRTEFSTR